MCGLVIRNSTIDLMKHRSVGSRRNYPLMCYIKRTNVCEDNIIIVNCSKLNAIPTAFDISCSYVHMFYKQYYKRQSYICLYVCMYVCIICYILRKKYGNSSRPLLILYVGFSCLTSRG